MNAPKKNCKILKKFFSICILTILFVLVGCQDSEVVSKEPIDKKYTESYIGVETDYKYQYDWLNGKFRYLPYTHSVEYPEKYEIEYKITYADNEVKKVWEEVSKEDYEEFQKSD